MFSRLVRLLVGVFVCVVAIAQPVSASSYRMPVDGVVIDPFRPPTNPYGPGNRGWELRVEPRSVVLAPADGVVRFAGQVGGTLTIVIEHDDGVRTTLSKLDTIDAYVKKGVSVTGGRQVGTAGGELYFGARCGSTYVDPSRLFDFQVSLVPLNGLPANHSIRPSICLHPGSVSSGDIAWLEATPREAASSSVSSLFAAAVYTLVALMVGK
jgi:murein DD-endopeptidase MepM/ murein hydrolase activator NlpD